VSVAPYNSSTTYPLDNGDAGSAQTLAAMRSLVDQAQASQIVQAAVTAALDGTPEKDANAEAAAIVGWLRARFRYQNDPVNVELVRDPRYALRQIQLSGTFAGDCDDASTLLAALLETAGYETRFILQGVPGQDFQHVLVEADLNGTWTPIDLTNRSAAIGWKSPALGREATEGRAMLGRLGDDTLDAGSLADMAAGSVTQAEDTAYADTAPSSYGTPGAALSSDASAVPSSIAAPSDSSVAGTMQNLFSASTAQSVLSLAERMGLYKPVVGYDSLGHPIYGSTIPVAGSQAAFSSLTQTLGGLPTWVWLLIGAGALVAFSSHNKSQAR
jgi:Transglutaminase-like superfamily